MNNILCRVDDRLVHGRFISDWILYYKPTNLIIIDDGLVDDYFMSGVYKALLPLWLPASILSVFDAGKLLRQETNKHECIMLLAKTPVEFASIVAMGVHLQSITLANKIYFPNKLEIPPASQEALYSLQKKGVKINAQLSPQEEPHPVRL